MREKGLIEDEALFIEGIKLEANENLYSFIRKRSIDKWELEINRL